MGLVLIWILFGIASMLLAGRYGRHRLGWFLLGFLFGPFGLLFLFCAGKREAPAATSASEPSAGELARRWNEYSGKSATEKKQDFR